MSPETTQDQSKEIALLADLSSQKRTVRVGAIVQLSKMATNVEVLRHLQKLTSDPDREVSLYASQAITRIRSRIGEVLPEATAPDRVTREQFLTPLPQEIPNLLKFIRDHPENISEDIQPSAAEFLMKNGVEADVEIVLSWLGNCNSLIALSFIESIESRFPRSLAPAFPQLLASEHPLIRVKAIAALRKIDPEEAMAHLEELLASRKAEDRIAGLSIAFVFPFRNVKALVLMLLAEETDPEVLKNAETLFLSNPEIDTALKMLDMIDVVPKNQAPGISKIFKSICEALRVVELLSPEEAKPEAMIGLWRRERLKKFLRDIEIQLTVGDKSRRESIESWLAKNLQNPEVASFVEKLGTNPETEDIYRKLAPSKASKSPSAEKSANRMPQTTAEKCNYLDSLDSESFKIHGTMVRDEARKGIPKVREAALNVLIRCGPEASDVSIGEQNIVSTDPAVVLSAIRLLEKIDIKKLMPFLEDLLKSEIPMIRVKGLRLALKLDFEKALKTLFSLLQSGDETTRAQAVSCIPVCPFVRVQDALTEALAKENHPDIARQMITILLSNPSSRVLANLDQIQVTVNPTVSMLIAQARMDLFDLILKFGLETFEPAKAEHPVAEPPAPSTAQINGHVKSPPEQESRQSEPPKGSKAAKVPENEIPVSATPPKPVSPPQAPAKTAREAPESPPPQTPVAPSAPVKSALGWAAKPYSVSETRNTMRKREVANRASQAQQKPSEKSPLLWIAAGGGILMILFMVLNFSPSGGAEHIEGPADKTTGIADDKNQASGENAIPEMFRIGAMCRLKGKIETINPDGSLSIAFEDKKLQVTFVASYPYMRGGETVEIDVLPYRKTKAGLILAEGHKITEK